MTDTVVELRGTCYGEIFNKARCAATLPGELDLLRAAVDASRDIIFVVASDGRVEYVNAAVSRLCAQRPEMILGKRLSTVFPPAMVKIMRADLDAVWSTAEPHYFEDQFDTSSGSLWLGAWLVPMRHPGETVPYAIMGVAREITDRKELERRYLQAQKMEAIGQLSGGIAHDFNNLLTAILGYSDLVLERVHDNEGLRGDVEEVKKAGERAKRLTQQLLAFSRKQVLRPEVLNLTRVVGDIVPMASRLIGENIHVDTSLSATSHAKADRGQVDQVLMNLIVNARDAMPGGGRLRIITADVVLDQPFVDRHPDALAGRYVSLTIEDDGCGMTPEVVAHVFEPFFTTKGPEKGTGLGLATVYGIAKQSGGYVNIVSTPGKGTSVTTYWPAVDETATAQREEHSTQKLTGTETVLIVEDEPALRALARRTLAPKGYITLEAANGAEALAVAESHRGPIHVLLTDMMMPGMNGPVLAQHLLRTRPDIRVLYVSGFAQSVIAEGGTLNAGARFLAKPFTPDRLAAAVRTCLDADVRGVR